jgi:uncharacterized membrane protein
MGEHVRARLRNLLQGFWFVPGLIAIALGALSFVVISIDRAAGPRGLSGAFDGDASAARSILSTIAGSLITVAGLAFTLTVVTLQLVSSQFTPRALRNFLGDRLNQLTAGSFVGIFLYCLLVLRSVRTRVEGQDGFIPALSVTVAILLADSPSVSSWRTSIMSRAPSRFRTSPPASPDRRSAEWTGSSRSPSVKVWETIPRGS